MGEPGADDDWELQLENDGCEAHGDGITMTETRMTETIRTANIVSEAAFFEC